MKDKLSIYGTLMTGLLLLFPSAAAASGQAIGGGSYHACSDVADTGISLGCADATVAATLTADSCYFQNFDAKNPDNTNFVCRVDFLSTLRSQGVLFCAYLTTYGLTGDNFECAVATPAEGSSTGSRDYDFIPRGGKVIHELATLCVDYATPDEDCYHFPVDVSLPGWTAGISTLTPVQLLDGLWTFLPTTEDAEGMVQNAQETVDAGSPIGVGVPNLM